jgi:hypothetical protein
MRILIEVRREDDEPLRRLAWDEHRSVREHAGFLLHQAIQAELTRRIDSDTALLAEPSPAA